MNYLRKWTWRMAIGLGIILALLVYYPVRTGFSRSAILASAAGIVVCLVLRLWKQKLARCLPLIPPVLLGIVLLLPGRDIDRSRLRAAYVESLQGYDGIRYVWGGEGFRGVDCSGLVRTALVDADFREAARTLNPALAREGLDLWWHDASARELVDGTQRQWTVRLANDATLKNASAMVQAGDLAVTADGSHVLAYMGGGKWIQADPDTLKVMELDAGAVSGWWIVKVIPCRWRCLQ